MELTLNSYAGKSTPLRYLNVVETTRAKCSYVMNGRSDVNVCS